MVCHRIDGEATKVGGNLIHEQPLLTPRKLRMICVGAGYSGLTLAYKFKYEWNLEEYVDLTIYEKNSDVGGTWIENRYPGVACDPNPEWKSFYASGPEIWKYIRRTTTKYNLDEHVKFNTKLLHSVWDNKRGKWVVRIQNETSEFTDEADILVNTTGFLNKWRWPDIKGLSDFQGTRLHSAYWDESADWTGKRVALIGNGSSAIQILPQIQPKAKHLTTYIRSPTWIASNWGSEFTRTGVNFDYTEDEKERFRDPEQLKKYRKELEHSLNQYFFGFIKDSPLQAAFREQLEAIMRRRLNNDEELCKTLIPKWDVGCRRLTPGDGYLEALQEENVSIEFSGIDEIIPTGIRALSGEEEEFDIIVCATGFDVSFTPSWKIEGVSGMKLSERWKEQPDAYFGVCVPQFPNYFMFTGPNSPLGHGGLFPVIDATSQYVLKWCHKIATEGIKRVMVTEEATKEYNEYSQEFLKRTVWASGCKSWYKNNTVEGPITAMYAGSVLHYRQTLERFRTEDFALEYLHRNIFRFMGNGFTETDLQGKDLAYYLEK